MRRNKGKITRFKFTQLVFIQSLRDKIAIPEEPVLTKSGMKINKGECDVVKLPQVIGNKYQSGTEKLMHMMRFSRPEKMQFNQRVVKIMSESNEGHLKAMYHTTQCKFGTSKRGLALAPKGKWN